MGKHLRKTYFYVAETYRIALMAFCKFTDFSGYTIAQ